MQDTREIGLAPVAADRPLAQIRAALTEQGWTAERPVTVISDGEATLPELVRRATRSDIHHVLDWWHCRVAKKYRKSARSRGAEPSWGYGGHRLLHCPVK